MPLLTLLFSNNRSISVKIHTRPSRADPTVASFVSLWGRNNPNPPETNFATLVPKSPRHHRRPSHRISHFCSFFFFILTVQYLRRALVFRLLVEQLPAWTPDSGIEKTQCAVRDICHLIKRLRGATCLYYHHRYFFFLPGFYNLCLLLFVLFCRVRNFASKQQKSKKRKSGGGGGALWSISGEQGVKKGCIRFIFIPVNSFSLYYFSVTIFDIVLSSLFSYVLYTRFRKKKKKKKRYHPGQIVAPPRLSGCPDSYLFFSGGTSSWFFPFFPFFS